jgi:excinuclease ABC subunit C
MTTAFDPKTFVQTLTPLPGVYRMLDASGQVLYVGKARNLKRRVASYFRANPESAKVRSLVAQIQTIEVTVTHTEGEALILESHLIKRHRPRYNVLLRDDKGYPYIHLSADPFPRLSLHRGPRRAAGRYFGPYPNATAAREALQLIQRVFQLRPCENSFFHNRSRPCLQYQIKRCTAPCTGLISATDYQHDVHSAVRLLEGRSSELIDALVERMEQAASELRFENAAQYRDQIAQLRQLQERQHVSGERGDLDVLAVVAAGGSACVQVFFFRAGQLQGNNSYFPHIPAEESAADILSAFIGQYYLNKDSPAELIVNQPLADADWLASALSERCGHRVTIRHRVRGERERWLQMAQQNAQQALHGQQASQAGMQRRFEALQDVLGLEQPPSRLECFDISHTQGEATVAACVVFNREGAQKSSYRRYNIRDVTAGDDYAAMQQALERRYRRHSDTTAPLPDVLFIDGGKGQLARARSVLHTLQINDMTLIGIAKGPERRPGQESVYLSDSNQPIILPPDSAALHLIQQIRDEAHRFAVAGHRNRRAKQRNTSMLERIAGIGPKRRQRLLKQFGGLQQLARAGTEDIAKVAGISPELAQRIYDAFHPNP